MMLIQINLVPNMFLLKRLVWPSREERLYPRVSTGGELNPSFRTVCDPLGLFVTL
jgi:hypothetical protein